MTTIMSLVTLLVALAATIAPLAHATNTYPIVLVNGFTGWGRDELGGVKYWGGLQGDIQEQLKAQGYSVYTASVGPFSSDWDRACELYAILKGGVVDYGAKHSAKYGHNRYGRNYTALYAEWGETNADGSVNKIHLLGHSMGGQTSRMLAQMLQKGTTGAPVEEDASSHPLFAGGKDWVHSITTISTPNQGTTLADGISEIGDFIKDLLFGLLSVIDIAGTDVESVYDVKMDQWNISARGDDESISDYVDRFFSSSVFKPGFVDICLYDLSREGAQVESTWIETLDNVYYYSYATIDSFSTIDWLWRKISLPNILTMLFILDPFSVFVGGRYAVDTLGLSTDWQPNDGLVNTISQSQDLVGDLVVFDGTAQIGKWNQMEQLTGLDHLAVIGFTLLEEVYDIYEAQAQLLYSLPADSGASTHRALLADADTTATTSPQAILANASVTSAISSLVSAAASIQTGDDLKSLCASTTSSLAAAYCAKMLDVTLAANTLVSSAASSLTAEKSTRHLRW